MRFAFTADQLALRDAVRDALAGECAPAVVRESWNGPVPALWATLAGLGVLGVNAPERCGGLGLGPLEWVLLLETAGWAAAPVTLLETVATNPWLAETGQDALLARVVGGDARVTVFLDGTYAREAVGAAMIVRIAADGSLSTATAPTLVPMSTIDGSRRLFSVDGRFEPVPGDGREMRARATLACAAELLGLGRRVLDMAVRYASVRQQFGRPIGSFQAVQHGLVDALVGLEFAAPLVYRAAYSLATGDVDASTHVSMAKVYASEAADVAAKKALQVHGAIGYTTECDLHLWMKRIFALRAAWGDVAWHEDRVAEAILGGPDA